MVEAMGWGVAVLVGIAWIFAHRRAAVRRVEVEEAWGSAQRQLRVVEAEAAELRAAASRRIRAAEDEARHAVRDLAGALLPVEDALFRAAKAEGDLASYREGVGLVHRQFEAALSSGGLEAILPSEGAFFDPRSQSCVAEEPGDEAGDLVVARVERRGWRLHDRLLRPAEVIVTRHDPTPLAQEGGEDPGELIEGVDGAAEGDPDDAEGSAAGVGEGRSSVAAPVGLPDAPVGLPDAAAFTLQPSDADEGADGPAQTPEDIGEPQGGAGDPTPAAPVDDDAATPAPVEITAREG